MATKPDLTKMDIKQFYKLRLVSENLNIVARDHLLCSNEFKNKTQLLFKQMRGLLNLSKKDFSIDNEIDLLDKEVQKLNQELKAIQNISKIK